MKPTEKHIEAAARAICIAQGYDPKTLDHVGSYSGLPLWKDKMGSAEAALSAALAVEAGTVGVKSEDWETPEARAKVLKRARQLWNADQYSCSWSQENREHYIIRASMEIALTTSTASSGVEGQKCPICAEAFKPTDLCASDIEMGTCHAACLEGSPVVDLETREPREGPISTYRFDEDAPAAPTAIDSIATEGPWQWWAGSTEEWCTVGPEASREAIIQAAINDCLGEGENDVGAWTLNFHIVEARRDPLRLADWIESDRLIERAEDNVADSDRAAGEYDDGPFFRVAPEIEKDLEERIKRACDEWQLAHGLTFTCRTFSHTRNDEDVVVDHPNATSEGPADV